MYKTNKYTALVISNDLSFHESVQQHISEDFECNAFNTIDKAMTAFKEMRVDLIVADIDFKNIDPTDLLYEIYKVDRNFKQVIIFLGSDYLLSTTKPTEIRALGAYEVLAKPSGLSILKFIAKRALKQNGVF